MNNTNRVLFSLCTCLILAIQSSATVLIPKDFKDLTQEADLVFVGTVVDIVSDWRDADETEIYTYVTFDNLEIVAGDYSDASLTVRFSGGQMGDVKVQYAGVPQFNLGERNLIFLSGNYVELCPVVGWIQGRFRVIYDDDVRDQVIHTDDGKPLAGIQNGKIVISKDETLERFGSPGKPDDQQAQVKAVTGPPTKMTLQAFSQAVRDLRQNLIMQGAELGYKAPIPANQTIPTDAVQPGGGESGVQRKVIGYDQAPQPVKTSNPDLGGD